ncbi:MAG: TRAP transporter substrate-binding protein [Deltaproteobacteria bacterium]|nr:TRAP transporter substrate-binding protein [Deltaproteobacteria bacterium]
MKIASKILIVAVAFAFATTFALSVDTPDSFAKPIKIRIGHVNQPGSLRARLTKLYTILAKQRLGDKVEFEIFGGGTLGGYKEMFEMVKTGSLECVAESIGTLEPWSPLGGIEAVPYLYRDLNDFRKFWRSPLAREFLDQLAKESGFVFIGVHWPGFKVLTTRKPVRTPEDLKAIKLRVPNMPTFISSWKAMGANVTPMAFVEVFSALQQGVIDGQNNTLSTSYDSGFGEVCKYIVLTDDTVEPLGWIYDAKYFSSLPADVQKGLKEAAAEAGHWHELSILLSNAEYIEKFKRQGCKIIVPDRKAFMEKAKNARYNPELQEWVEKIRQYMGT